MRIVLIGQAAFGEAVLRALLVRGHDIVAVFAPPSGRREEPLAAAARAAGIVAHQPSHMRDDEARQAFLALDADLGVMAFVTDIVPRRLLDHPRLGTIQYHPSLLPRHRGGSAINWAVIQGETKTGLTIFWPDAGIDTGPILLQREVEIAPDDTVGSVYFDKLFPLGVEALAEAVDMVAAGTASRLPQDESQATYEGLCTDEVAVIDWSRPGREVYNLIRGANPQPGASTTFRGQPLKLFDSSFITAAHASGGPPGEIEIVADGLVVATADAVILVRRVQPPDAAKMAALDYASAVGLRSGERFGAV